MKALAKTFVELKSYDLQKYNAINTEFSTNFPNVSFNAQPPNPPNPNGASAVVPKIEIREKNPFTCHTKTFDLENSASGYYEVMYLLLEKAQEAGR